MPKYQCTECDLSFMDCEFESDLLLCPSCGSRLEEIYFTENPKYKPLPSIERKRVFLRDYSDAEIQLNFVALLWMGLVFFSVYFSDTFIPAPIIRNISTGITFSTMMILTVLYLVAINKRSPFIMKYFSKAYKSSLYKYGYVILIPFLTYVCLAFPLKSGLPYIAHKLICKEGTYSATIVGIAPTMQLCRNGIYLKEINSNSTFLFCGFKRPIYESLTIGEKGSFTGTVSWFGFDLSYRKKPIYYKKINSNR